MKHTRSLIKLVGSIALLTSAGYLQADENLHISLSDDVRLKHESTGIIGGAVIGGILGGPVGAIATAAFGGWVSDKTLAKKENTLLNAALTDQQQALTALQAQYRALEAQYQLAALESRNARVRNASFNTQSQPSESSRSVMACCSDSEISLHFKSSSTQIESLYDDKLSEFAALVNTLPGAVIGITGHADRRGDSQMNLALSQRRVQAVEKKLQALGVTSKSLQTSAFGEGRPLSPSDTLEDNFFDRRVVLKIISTESSLLTRNTD